MKIFLSNCSTFVLVPANITQPPLSSIKMKIGLRVTLNCSARGFPFPSFTWIKDGTGLNETGRVETSEYAIAETIKRTTSLTISSLTRKDTGTYLCKASNLAGNSSKTANLIVLGKNPFRPLGYSACLACLFDSRMV